TGSANLMWGGLVIFLLFGAGATAAFTFRGLGAAAMMVAGCVCLLAGMTLTLFAILTTTAAAFFLGAAIAGPGFGLAFLGSFRRITALATATERAGVVAAVYVVGYLAFSVPALIAGTAVTRFGLHPTALIYSASLAGLAAVALVILSAVNMLIPRRNAGGQG
ncbi:MAG TPA: hypothetical protein VEL03_09720, partial [Streptosporangiaceae bacterium]|nr:hypothetical protein [Streptosporangiaceae bacterium]